MSYIETIREKIEVLNDGEFTHCYLNFKELNLKGVPYMCELLRNAKMKTFTLNGLDIESVKQVTEALKYNTLLEELAIHESDVGDEGARYVADLLKKSHITNISLGENIGDDGAKYLAEQLKESNVVEIDLQSNKIGDDGLRTLADLWKGEQIKTLILYRNKISTRSSEIIGEMLQLANKRCLGLCVFDPADNTKYVEIWHDNLTSRITVGYKTVSDAIAEFVNKTFSEIILRFINVEYLSNDEVKSLKRAIKGVTIREFEIIICDSNAKLFKHIPEIFGNHHIHKISLSKLPEVSYFLSFLKSNVSHLDIFSHVDNMDQLVETLKSSNIRYLSISDTGSLSANQLACAIKHTKIVNLDLGQSLLRETTLNELKNTQVTRLKLLGTLDEETADYLADIIEESQLVSIEFAKIYMGVSTPTERYLRSLFDNKKKADAICAAFDNLVTLDLKNNKLKFMLPKYSGALDQYASFIETLHKTPNVRAHIIYDRLEIAEKIDAFVDNLQDHFNSFVNNNIEDLVEKYENFNFVEFVKKFDTANLGHVVQNLLLHRHLYFIDEKAEILHPFIYKMLHKYELPLFSEKLEPNKKTDIIKYYEERPEIQGVQDLLEILR